MITKESAEWADAMVELSKLVNLFEVTELRVLLFVARRLAMGRVQYGVLNPNDGRDWTNEMLEEMADLMVYRSAKEQKE